MLFSGGDALKIEGGLGWDYYGSRGGKCGRVWLLEGYARAATEEREEIESVRVFQVRALIPCNTL